MAPRSVRTACDRNSYAPFAKVGHRIGDEKLLSRAPSCFGKHVKPLVPAAFAVEHALHSQGGFKSGRRSVVKISC
jgi:hypothetical protein